MPLSHAGALSDVPSESMAILKSCAQDFIAREDERLDHVCAKLTTAKPEPAC